MPADKKYVLFVIAILFSLITPAQQHEFPYNPAVAHRGAWKAKGLPENSIASLKEAIRLGCAGSEFDVRMTSDDSLVINHDEAYHYNVIEKSGYTALLDTPLSNGEKLPTLREYITAGMQNNAHTTLVIEIKPSGISKERAETVAEKVVNLVHALKAETNVCYISFDIDILKKIRSMDSSAVLQYLEGDISPAALHQLGINGTDFHFSVYSEHPGWTEEARANKMTLNVWTVNDKEQLQHFADLHFDYITTNEPGLLLELLQQDN